MTICMQDLKESNDFLNLLLSNINSAVLIVDESLEIHQFNDFFVTLFDSSLDTFVEKSFGRVTGCINAVREKMPCGKTSQCGRCILRQSLIKTITDKVPADRVTLDRVFYVNNQAVQKHLEFSTRNIDYQGRRLILVIIYDVTDIEQKKIELEKKQQLIDQDLKAAAGIQKSLLPSQSPDIPHIRVAWKFEPCEQVGGDIFNIHKLNAHTLCLYMLDVCGHGVSGALIAVSVSQFLQSLRESSLRFSENHLPEAVLESLNQSFPFERFESYFSIVFATINLAEGILTYSCAGHPPPILISAAGSVERLQCRGPVIGLHADHVFCQRQRMMRPGDRVLFYTDGLLECRNPNGEFFGRKRLEAALQNFREKPVQGMIDGLYNSITRFRGNTPPDDDISLMVVEYT